ncbi:hypothetical protein E2320_010824, partial [Naja naja]
VKIKWTEKNAKEVTKWRLAPETKELPTSLLKEDWENPPYLHLIRYQFMPEKNILESYIQIPTVNPIRAKLVWTKLLTAPLSH